MVKISEIKHENRGERPMQKNSRTQKSRLQLFRSNKSTQVYFIDMIVVLLLQNLQTPQTTSFTARLIDVNHVISLNISAF